MKFNDIYDTARPYIACFVILRNDQGEIAMLRRQNTGWMDGFLGLPAGKVEYGETFTQATVREAKEEAGVDIAERNLQHRHTTHRHGIEGKGFMDWVDVYFEAVEWSGDPYNAEEEKASELVWVNIDKMARSIVPSQLDALQKIHEGALYSEFGWQES